MPIDRAGAPHRRLLPLLAAPRRRVLRQAAALGLCHRHRRRPRRLGGGDRQERGRRELHHPVLGRRPPTSIAAPGSNPPRACARGRPPPPPTSPAIATASPWRAGIEQRYACEKPAATTILDGRPAELLNCTQRRGGWPHVALVALVGGHAWYADGVLPAATVMERAIGVRAGLLRADAAPPSSAADALLAQRLAAQSVSSGDIGQFDTLMAAGTRANLADNPAAAEAAFRAALALQQKALGADNPNTADRGDDAGAATLRRGPVRRGGGAVRPRRPAGAALGRPDRAGAAAALSRARRGQPRRHRGGAGAAAAGRRRLFGADPASGPCAPLPRAPRERVRAARRLAGRQPGPADRPGGAGGAARADRGAAQPGAAAARRGQARRQPRRCSPTPPASPRPTGWSGRSWRRGCSAPAASPPPRRATRRWRCANSTPRRAISAARCRNRSRSPTPTCCAPANSRAAAGRARRCRSASMRSRRWCR